MKASVDPQVCIGCTLCTQICPSIFKMESEKAIAYQDLILKDNYECVRSAAEQCPVEAIILSKSI